MQNTPPFAEKGNFSSSMFLPRRSAKYPLVISFTLQKEKIDNFITNFPRTSSYSWLKLQLDMPQKVNIYISLLSSFLASFLPIFFSALSSWMAAVFVMRRLCPIIKVGLDFCNILLEIPAIFNFGQQHFLSVQVWLCNILRNVSPSSGAVYDVIQYVSQHYATHIELFLVPVGIC